TLTHRKADDPFMLWIGELEKPLGYEVRRVGGPGSPGVLFVEGERVNVRRLYSPPSVDQIQGGWVDLPEAKFVIGIQLDSTPPGPPPGSRCIGAMDGTALYIYDYHWALPSPPKQGPDPSPLYQVAEMRQLQTQENLNFELEEAEKMAAGAQAQLEHDIATIENTNTTIRERNDRLVTALRRISGKKFGPDREDWLKWWTERRGYEYVPPQKEPKKVVDVQVPLPYVPQGGPRQFVPDAGGGGGGFKWCLVYEKQKDKKPNTGQCFAAGTIVLTPRGPRPIETLRPGDALLSRAELDGPSSTDIVE
ncbi:Hint domain-containing protein, partial [Singulisphaera rosea]